MFVALRSLFFPSRYWQVIQYISLVRPDAEGEEQPYGDYLTTTFGSEFPWLDPEGFSTETTGGHGSHTAGTAAGTTITFPVQLEACARGEELGCLGGCLDSNTIEDLTSDFIFDPDTLCPRFDCDGYGKSLNNCLDDDTADMLTRNGGVAPGAKLAIFDVSLDGTFVWAELALNGLWEATSETGCKVHSNSWGGTGICTVDDQAVSFDQYMYEVGAARTQHEYAWGAGRLDHPTGMLLFVRLRPLIVSSTLV